MAASTLHLCESQSFDRADREPFGLLAFWPHSYVSGKAASKLGRSKMKLRLDRTLWMMDSGKAILPFSTFSGMLQLATPHTILHHRIIAIEAVVFETCPVLPPFNAMRTMTFLSIHLHSRRIVEVPQYSGCAIAIALDLTSSQSPRKPAFGRVRRSALQ